jgi:dihydroxyacetone kinase-like protein
MTNTFTKELLVSALKGALASVVERFDELNALDAATGDGDHGTAIEATLKAAVESAQQPGGLSDALSNVAMGIMSATGGSTSSLNGSFYMGLSSGATSDELDPAATVKMYESGLDMLKTMTTAQVGDKTMMDAMIPAIEAMSAAIAANPSATLADVFNAAATAAKEGAEKTSEYVAKFGRARNLGERSRGSQDAGATSLALIFQAFADAVANA